MMPRTEAARRLLVALEQMHPSVDGVGVDWLSRIDAIEAEAVATERARLAEAVRALPDLHQEQATGGAEPVITHAVGWVSRAAVRALLEKPG